MDLGSHQGVTRLLAGSTAVSRLGRGQRTHFSAHSCGGQQASVACHVDVFVGRSWQLASPRVTDTRGIEREAKRVLS